MKKVAIVIVVLVLLLVAAPWGIGKLAEKRVNASLDQLVAAAPYLTIAERKWTPGWFRSEQEVTFEVLGPWTRMLEDAANTAVAAAATAAAADAPTHEEAAAGAGTVESENEGPEAEGDTESDAPPAVPPLPIQTVKFTVRNEILHGPVLWPASLGLARVNSRLVLTEDIRKQLVDFFGTDQPVRISTRVGFLGGGVTRISTDAREITTSAGSRISWAKLAVDVDYSRDFDDIDMDGEWSRFESSSANGEKFVLDDMELEASSERIRGALYATDFDFTIDEVRFVGADQAATTMDDVRYAADTEVNGDFLDVAARFGSGKVTSKELGEMGLKLDEVHYDFTFRHLHVETLEKFMSAMKRVYSQPASDIGQFQANLMSPFTQHGIELLTHDPEFVIDRIGVVTPDGKGTITGVVRLKGVTAEDVSTGFMGLIGKIEADITVEAAQKLVEKFPNGATAAGAAVDGGYAQRDGDKLVSRIEFKQGQLSINGKPQGIPGLGGPPMQEEAPPPGESDESPQE